MRPRPSLSVGGGAPAVSERDPNGMPVSPADEIMRERVAKDNEEWGYDRYCRDPVYRRYIDSLPVSDDPDDLTIYKTIVSVCIVALLTILVLALAGCGGQIKPTINPTAEPPIQIEWIREVCGMSAKERYDDLLRINQEMEGEAAVVIACPEVDIVQMSFQEGEYLGFPARRVFADFYYFLPEYGPVSSARGSEPGKPVRGHPYKWPE